jgi:hypothetical protein
VLSPSARHVFGTWPAVQAAVLRALQAHGIHVHLHNSGIAALRSPAIRRWAAEQRVKYDRAPGWLPIDS